MDDSLSVSQLYQELKFHIETSFSNVKINGELSSFIRSQAGHYYFSLKDDDSILNGAFFKFDAMKSPDLAKLKDGDLVEVRGKVTLYNKRSNIQVIAKSIKALNKKGHLKEKFEKLKLKLSKEGIFDISQKKKIPENVKKIAIISSPSAAGLQDFLKIMKRNCFFYDILIFPSLVQGEKAAPLIIEAMKKVAARNDIDLLVLTRGGGSLEDLWCFNDEKLVREISSFEIPVLTAIGHERDNTLSDFTADLRVETPSAAAEYLSNSQSNLIDRYSTSRKDLLNFKERFLYERKIQLEKYRPSNMYKKIFEGFNSLKKRVESCSPRKLIDRLDIYSYLMRIEDAGSSLKMFSSLYVQKFNSKMTQIDGLLQAINPQNVMKRGYSYIKNKKKVIGSLKEFDKISKKDELEVHFHDGVKGLY